MSAQLHHGDAGIAQATAKAETTRHPALVLVTCILASSLAFVDGTVVNVGLPAIGKGLGGDAAGLQWVINAYLLPLSALLLLGGALGDRFGRRRLLNFGVILFGLGSAGCAASPNLAGLLAARAAQGVGAALLLPNSLAILGATFEGEAKGRAVGAWAAASAITGAVGPVLGGWLIDAVGWRAIFLINLPLALGAVGLALAAVRDPPAETGLPPPDWLGAGLATLALGGLVTGLTEGSGPDGWTPLALAAVAAGVIVTAGFLWNEIRLGDRALTPPALFGSATLMGLNLLTFLLYGALGGLLVLIPFMLIEAAHYRATAAGAALLPFPLLMAIGAPLSGQLAGRLGSRYLLAGGSLVVAIAFLLALRIGDAGGYWTEVLPCLLVFAVGMCGVAAPLTTAVLSAVDARHTGAASGLNSAVARTGGLVAVALLGWILAQRGRALIAPFHVAMAVGAIAAGSSSLIALTMLKSPRRRAD